MHNEKIIEVKGLSRAYGKNLAVNDISFSVRAGTVHGFLGPNGAGKTTVIKILLGLILPDSGAIKILQKNLFTYKKEILSKVGAVVEAPSFFEYLTAYENLKYLSNFSAETTKTKIFETLEIVGLEKVANKKVETFSYGMKQRLGIAQALLPDNKLIFLDEPTNGLDPYGISGVRKLIKKLSKEKNVTVFLSSHLLSEVEQTCDYVTIIDKGKLIIEAGVSELLHADQRVEILCASEKSSELLTADDYKICSEEKISDKIRLIISASEDEIPKIVSKLCENRIKIYRIGKIKQKLEDIFVELTKDNQRDTRSDRF